jgi:hypothetical protein
MGECPNCHIFTGIPTCAACKTYFRVGSILRSGKLCIYQEAAVVGALRNCAGALSDLIEVGVDGPFGASGVVPDTGEVGEIGKEPVEKAVDKEGEKSKAAVGEEKVEKKAKVPKKEKHKSKRKEKAAKAKSPSKIREEANPDIRDKERGDRGGALRSSGSRATRSPGKEAESPTRNRRGERSPQRDNRKRSHPSTEDLDREVRRDPERFELKTIPIRGTAGGRPREGTIPAHHRRPAEPVGPPPRDGRREDGYNRDSRGSGSGQRENKYPRWKGYSHYNRGVDYWKRRKGQK